jgi:AcrR family transcriptional regulator
MIRARALPRETPRSRAPRKASSRQQARTDATRRRLLAAAAEVFARHGFEASRLEDIASLAGNTRGAFYANFPSKEDIFFALLEEWVAERIAELNAILELHRNPANLFRALRRHYAEIAKNRDLALLSVEFKLFAIRHPIAHERLLARHERLRSHCADFLRRVAKVLGRTLPVSSVAAGTALSALSNALVLDHSMDPEGINEREIEHLLGMFFDAILGPKATK